MFARGAVRELEPLEPDQLYTAVVREGKDYEVGLEYAEGDWASECSCMMADCQHVVAALLELHRRASATGKPTVSERARQAAAARARVAAAARAHWAKARAQESLQPPPSPLRDRLAEKLGRDLQPHEASFVRAVQGAYSQARFRPMTEGDLNTVAGRPVAPSSFDDWKPVNLWPEYPHDDFHFWLHVAWELRRRNVGWPAFLDSITDLSLMEPALRAWARSQEIEHWKNRFRELDGRAQVANAGLLDLRLAIFPAEARLQWRIGPEAEFTDLKPAQAKKFSNQFSKGALTLTPDSLPLWSASDKPWTDENWWSFNYDDPTARLALNRLLRMQLAPDRVVTAEGQPLPRAVEPLRLNLISPQANNGDYDLSLTTADGSLPPRVLSTLPGQPTLYLTEGGLFHGPPSDALQPEWRKTIPAEALETSDGLGFLHTAGIPLPPRLQDRFQLVPVAVTISCRLKPVYPGSPREDIIITVTAKAPGMAKEKFTTRGWEPASHFEAQKPFKTERDLIKVHDRLVQKHFPRVLELLGPQWSGFPGDWRLRLTKQMPEVFVSWLKSLPPEIEVLLDRELATLRQEPVSGTLSLDVDETGMDWFDLKIALNASDTTLTPEELKLLLNARGAYVRLGKRGWRRLRFNLAPGEDEQLARLGLDARDFSAEPQRFHALQLADPAAKRFLAPERPERSRPAGGRHSPWRPGPA